MRYENLKCGDIFAGEFGIYIKTNFGPAVNLENGNPVLFNTREEVEKRCCATCMHHRNKRCVNGNSKSFNKQPDRLSKCKEWEGLI